MRHESAFGILFCIFGCIIWRTNTWIHYFFMHGEPASVPHPRMGIGFITAFLEGSSFKNVFCLTILCEYFYFLGFIIGFYIHHDIGGSGRQPALIHSKGRHCTHPIADIMNWAFAGGWFWFLIFTSGLLLFWLHIFFTNPDCASGSSQEEWGFGCITRRVHLPMISHRDGAGQ